jgi:hypothetical protein
MARLPTKPKKGGKMFAAMGSGVMATRQVLALLIEVRVLAPQLSPPIRRAVLLMT